MSDRKKQTPSEAITGYLESVDARVREITDPRTDKPVEIPHFDVLLQAAGKLDESEHPADTACVIQSLLRRGQNYDMEPPGADFQLEFPKDHHLHPGMGMEFYFLACNLQTTGPDGEEQPIGVSLWMQKNRLIGVTAQKEAGWSDDETFVFSSSVAAVLGTSAETGKTVHAGTHAHASPKGAPPQSAKPGEHQVRHLHRDPLPGSEVRRSRNLQWPVVGGDIAYSKPGEDFCFRCGADSFEGTENVLPLRARVDDGDHLSFDLQADCLEELEPEKAFFLQGTPMPDGGGNGVSYLPTPGFQYSWPQLQISGTLTVEGTRYEVQSGTGFVVHQVMMNTLENGGDAPHPVPYVEDPEPFVGWSWQFFNFDNKDAATFVGVNIGGFYLQTNVMGGFYATLKDGEWVSKQVGGTMALGDFTLQPTVSDKPGPGRSMALIPTTWMFDVKDASEAPAMQGVASAWGKEGAFNLQDWSLFSEMPVTYTDTSGQLPGGVGYCESFGFESVLSYYMRAVAFLETGEMP